jgi:DNA-directed RNA polymerase subunit RPC12/RpoP
VTVTDPGPDVNAGKYTGLHTKYYDAAGFDPIACPMLRDDGLDSNCPSEQQRTMSTEDGPVAQCPACGAELPTARYEKTVTCTYCSAKHVNTTCLALQSEVLVRCKFGYELTRVTSCNDPAAIGLADRTGVVDLDDVIPVVRVTGPLEKGVEVFRRGDLAWERTWTASALRNGHVQVKHGDGAFQGEFFDERAALDEIRLDARRSRQRSALQAFVTNLREEPILTIVTQVSEITGSFVRAVYSLIVVSIVVALVIAAFKLLLS